MASVRPQNRFRHASTSPTCTCTPRKSFAPVASTPFEQQAGYEIELDGQSRATMEHEAGRKPERGKKLFTLVDVAVGEHILPRDKNLIEDDDRIVFIEAAR